MEATLSAVACFFSILSLEYKCCCFFSIEVVLNLLVKIWDHVSAKKVSIA